MYGQQDVDATYKTSERRSMPRWEVRKPVFCHFEKDGDVYQGISENLNYFGVCLNVDKELELKQDAYLAVKLSDDDVVYLHGKVAWCQKDGTGKTSKVGLQLSAVDDVARDLIYKHSFQLHRKEFIDNFFKGWDV